MMASSPCAPRYMPLHQHLAREAYIGTCLLPTEQLCITDISMTWRVVDAGGSDSSLPPTLTQIWRQTVKRLCLCTRDHVN
jgi:hypothetical protein